MPRKAELTEVQLRLLGILRNTTYDNGLPARAVAKLLWPDSPGWQRHTRRHDGISGAMGGGMWMKAGAFLGRMAKRGFVGNRYREHTAGEWYITNAGARLYDWLSTGVHRSQCTDGPHNGCGCGCHVDPAGV